MNSFTNLFSIMIVGCWMLAIAFISVQNAQPIRLVFFSLQTIAIPFGLLLTFTTIVGMIGYTLLQPIFFGVRRSHDDEF